MSACVRRCFPSVKYPHARVSLSLCLANSLLNQSHPPPLAWLHPCSPPCCSGSRGLRGSQSPVCSTRLTTHLVYIKSPSQSKTRASRVKTAHSHRYVTSRRSPMKYGTYVLRSCIRCCVATSKEYNRVLRHSLTVTLPLKVPPKRPTTLAPRRSVEANLTGAPAAARRTSTSPPPLRHRP